LRELEIDDKLKELGLKMDDEECKFLDYYLERVIYEEQRQLIQQKLEGIGYLMPD
jgi:hypothetical protein